MNRQQFSIGVFSLILVVLTLGRAGAQEASAPDVTLTTSSSTVAQGSVVVLTARVSDSLKNSQPGRPCMARLESLVDESTGQPATEGSLGAVWKPVVTEEAVMDHTGTLAFSIDTTSFPVGLHSYRTLAGFADDPRTSGPISFEVVK